MRIEDFCNVTDGGLVLREKLQTYTRRNILTCDPAMHRQLDMLDRAGNTNVPLMIYGEAGCGKDTIAQYAHAASCRKDKPLLKINCAYLPEGQIANELFGVSGGAPGLLSRAAGGSLYIENINLLSSQTQYHLMEYINSSAGKPNDIRYMICVSAPGTSNREHGLIEPLLYYFNSMSFVIPPLRERPDDMILLTMQQLRNIYEQFRLERTISLKVMSAILAYDWPGNIRQLTKVIDRMAFMSDNTKMDSIQLLESCLSDHQQFHLLQTKADHCPKSKTLKELVLDYEVMIINQYTERYGSLRKAAAALDVSHSVLSSKLTKYYAASVKKSKDS